MVLRGVVMRRYSIVLAGVLGLAAWFAPLSWTDDRKAAEPRPIPVAAPLPVDSLTLAAECLDRGDDAGAVPHLKEHVRAHPDALVLRLHLAEVLRKIGRTDEARSQFERFVSDAQTADGPAATKLVHAHTRLMELADDEYGEHLHRGIGLVLLVRKWTADPERRDAVASEQTLAKAAKALKVAIELRPRDPRANLYLAEAFEGLGQPSAARTAIRTARAGMPDAAVTDAERERLGGR